MRFDFLERRAPVRRVVKAYVLTLALAAAAPLAAPAQTPASCRTVDSVTSPDTSLRRVGALRPGDLLRINVFREKEISGEYMIDSDGRLVIPGLGAIRAAGLDPREFEARLQALLECQGIVPDVAVQVQIRVAALGEVRSPGTFPVDPGISVLQLLTVAGGPTGSSDLAKARVIRGGRSYPVNLQAALAGDPSGNVVLNSNDVLVIPKKGGFTRENIGFVMGFVGVAVSMANLLVTIAR